MSQGDAATPPLVTCIVIFLDSERYLDEAIRSIVGQRGFDSWNLVLVDDGSCDGSTEIAQEWAAAQPGRIRYADHPDHENLGMSASRNLGVELANGSYVAFLDSDDVWLPGALAHRMRVAAAHPRADVIVGGTWRWHSWTGEEKDYLLDIEANLPRAVHLTTLPPPALFHAIYSTPGGGYVPTMCSLVVRRGSLRAVGGSEAEFTGMYEDQALYAKLGLGLSAVIDPRPLALYRQHADSTCSRAITAGEWARVGRNESVLRFFIWLQRWVDIQFGSQSNEHDVVQRNIDFFLEDLDEPEAPPRRPLVYRVARKAGSMIRRQVGERGDPSIVAAWSRRYLEAIVRSSSGDVLVAGPSDASGEPWRDHIPAVRFHVDTRAVHRSLRDVDTDARFDHIIVPFGSSGGYPSIELFERLKALVVPDGTLTVMSPGKDWPAGASDLATRSRAEVRGADIESDLRRQFPGLWVSVETFGSATTYRAVASRTAAPEVPGVALDKHDPVWEVVVGIHIAVDPRRALSALDRSLPSSRES